jgi:hypothetical protein
MDAGLLTIMSTAFSVVGNLMGASSRSNAADYNAQLAQQNAAIAQQQGAAAAAAQAKQARIQIGSMVANYGASGVDSGQGSPLDVLQDSVATAKLDNLTTQYNYNLRALGYQNQSQLYGAQSSSAMTSGLLGAAGAAAKGYGDYQKTKPPTTPGNPIAGISDDYVSDNSYALA